MAQTKGIPAALAMKMSVISAALHRFPRHSGADFLKNPDLRNFGLATVR
ncbi:MAG: hypothetical protein MUF86_01820 [Akkermansiaceae bacterium]|jgi:hypothetical protein|nr:hypothetical protein [Akkermansiaceae bacterium]MCU0776389.1 hypothetical protein [Akkermansiaceae bacterium]